jgi:hypothetical protein
MSYQGGGSLRDLSNRSLKDFDPMCRIIGYQGEPMPRGHFNNSTKGVEGATPDTYKRTKQFHSPDGSLRVHDIDGASPSKLKFTNRPPYNLMSKDATGELSQRKIRKHHNPLDPRYIISDKGKT